MVDPMCQVPFYDDYLCSALSAKGIDVTLFAREPSFIKGYFKKRNYSFRNLNRYTRKLFSEKSSLGKFLKYSELILFDLPKIFYTGMQSDVVHVQWFSPYPFGIVELWCYALLKLFGTKIIFPSRSSGTIEVAGNHCPDTLTIQPVAIECSASSPIFLVLA